MTFARHASALVAAGAGGMALVVLVAARQAPVRDQPPVALVGTASISGVVADDRTGGPIRHALVSAGGPPGGLPVSINTDDAGRFNLDALPAGPFRLYVSCPGYLRSEYGASKPGSPGTSILLTEGQHVTGVTVRLVRGAVITGTISDTAGVPLSGVEVRLMKWGYSTQTGERLLVRAGGRATDDRGVYRVFEIPAGTYFLATTAEPGIEGLHSIPGWRDPVEAVTHDDVIAVLRGGGPSSRPAAFSVHGVSPGFYPGTPRLADAIAITVAAGEERIADVHLPVVTLATVRGSIIGAETAPDRIEVQLLSVDREVPGNAGMEPRARIEGSAFRITEVRPGDYMLMARTFGAGPALFATLPLTVAGTDISNQVLALRPATSVSGRVVFEGAAPPPGILKTLRIGLSATGSTGSTSLTGAPAAIDETGRFAIAGIVPGQYRVELKATSGFVQGGWWLKSALFGGQDLADGPAELSADVTGVVVTLSDHPSQISGTLRSDTGETAMRHWVIAFSTNRAEWRPLSRRVIGVPSGSDGKFLAGRLPAGEYYVAVVNEVEPGQWFDPSFLQDIADKAIRVRLAEGETKTQDLVIR